jgi:flagellar M-ring protein FliF
MPNTQKLRDTWRHIEPRGQLTIVISFLMIAVVGYMLYSYASQTSWNAVQTGVNPADTNRITAALSGAGIPYRVGNGGTEVDVPVGKEGAAQVALASKGIGAGSQIGLDAVTKTSLGMTDLQQHVLYQEGLQGELERQIEGISGISSAQVTLVLPQDTLFQDRASQASAAVLLSTTGIMNGNQVGGIAHMVAAGVPGLDAQNVTITDNMGEMLWPAPGAADGTLTATSKLAAEQNYNSQLAAQINSVIASTLGPGKGTADVNADLNVDQTTQDSVTYSGVKTPLQSQTGNETLNSNGSTPAGITGTGGNVPPTYTGGTGGTGQSTYQNKTDTTTYGNDKTVTHTIVAPGSVNKLSVALLFDSSVQPAAQTAMANTVKAMIGYTASRGDMISTASVPFQKQAAATSGAASAGPMGLNIMQMARYAGIGVACLIFLFFVRRNLKKREGEPLFAEPKWLADIQQSVPLAALEPPHAPAMQSVSPAEHARREQMHKQVNEIVEKSPDQVAIQVTQWMNET